MTNTKHNTALCTYRVRRGKERAFLGLLKRHWPTLRKLGLVTPTPSLIYRGKDESKKTFFVEIFTWKSAKAVSTAHEHPQVMAIWEPMGALLEERLGRPSMEFPHVEQVQFARPQV